MAEIAALRERLGDAVVHAAMCVGWECAENFTFRCGPCNACQGACFCRGDDELTARLLTGQKPVGSFAYRRKKGAKDEAETLRSRGLSTWTGKNRWGMYCVVAALYPNRRVAETGTPRDVAFTQDLIDELYTLDVIGKMYGYRK
jgi:hypothetical protein